MPKGAWNKQILILSEEDIVIRSLKGFLKRFCKYMWDAQKLACIQGNAHERNPAEREQKQTQWVLGLGILRHRLHPPYSVRISAKKWKL